jgi:NADH-quinone oxidoreductase subunit N
MTMSIDLQFIYPLIILSFVSLIMPLFIAFFRKTKNIVYYLTIITLIFSILSCFLKLNVELTIFNESIRINSQVYIFSILVLVSVLFAVVSSKSYIEKMQINFPEFYSMVLFSSIGMLLMIFANDLLILFIGIELMSICFYVLVGFTRKFQKSNESALKYLLLGAFMTGFLLYGISLIYGISGTTNISKIIYNPQIYKLPAFLVGVSLFIIGLLFKIGVFPFHLWIPDVYEGAPTVVTGLMSTAGKISAVGALSQFVLLSPINFLDFRFLFSILAVMTIILGNVIAIAQYNLKRLLAYSSIASAGYIIVGLAGLNDVSLKSILFYLMSYVFMQLGAFILISGMEEYDSNSNSSIKINIDDYKGLAKRNPSIAIIFTIFLFSLSGIPPFAGFWGKYYLFFSAIKSDLIWLSIIAILFSLISVYYYLRIVVFMWFYDYENKLDTGIKFDNKIILYIAVIGTLLFGIYPELFFSIFSVK